MAAFKWIKMKAYFGMEEFAKLDFRIPTLLRMINYSSSVNRDSNMIYIAMIARYEMCITFRSSISTFLFYMIAMNPQNNYYRPFDC